MAVSRAVLKGQTVFEVSKDSRAAEDYKALADEFIKRFSCKFDCEITNSKQNV